MDEIMFERFVSEELSCAEMPPISALSPLGLLLAYPAGRENSSASVTTEGDTPHRWDQASSSSIDAAAAEPLPCYRIVIARRMVPVTAVGRSSQETVRRSSSLWKKGGELTCLQLRAAVTALQWLDDSHLTCGLQDGTVVIISRRSGTTLDPYLPCSSEPGSQQEWTVTLSRRFHHLQQSSMEGRNDISNSAGVVRIRMSGEGSSSTDTVGNRGSEPTLWVLYKDQVVVCVGVDPLVALARQELERQATSSKVAISPIPLDENQSPVDESAQHQGSTPGPSFAKLQLEGQGEVLDVVACSAPPGLFDVRSERHAHVILAAGVSPALAFYPIGPETRSFGLASIAWAVATHVTSLTVGAIGGIFGLVGLRGRGVKVAEKAAKAVKAAARVHGAGGGGGSNDEDGEGGEESPAPLVLRWDGGLQDGFRRVTRLCLDPSGRLAAAADGFGRVMLVDCATRQILRMWKGVRDAECGWVEVVEYWEGRRVASVGQKRLSVAATSPHGEEIPVSVIGLYLAILAPLRGRVELWRMRHGPCVRLVPAPPGARLLTCRPELAAMPGKDDNTGGRSRPLTRCYLLSDAKGAAGAGTRFRVVQLSLQEGDLAELPSRLCREPAVDDDYRLRKFATAVDEKKVIKSTATDSQPPVGGERMRLPEGQEAREEILFQMLAELESVESLMRGLDLLGGSAGVFATSVEGGSRSIMGPTPAPGAQTDVMVLSAAFQQRLSALCHERAELAAAAEKETDTGKSSTEVSRGESSPGRNTAAISALRFRVAAYELYGLLESVELQPAGVAGGDEDGDTSFLPPGKRGWRHTLLCEEAAGWADMAREGAGARGEALPCAQLPDFQEFLDTVSVVLEVEQAQKDVSSGDLPAPISHKTSALPLLRLKAPSEGDLNGRSGTIIRDSAALLAPSPARDPSAPEVTGTSKEYTVCRQRLVGWLFRPLLSDAFAMASLTQALSLMGLGEKGEVIPLIRDLAEWFLALPVGRAADITVGREAQNCPVLRWLKGVILQAASSPRSTDSASPEAWTREHALLSGGGNSGALASGKVRRVREMDGARERMKDLFDETPGGVVVTSRGDGGSMGYPSVDEWSHEEGDEFEADAEEILRPMYDACAASQRLENASMLSVVVAEALSACRERLEESSLGQVAIGGEETWLELVRRLRLCLFVDRRLRWKSQPEQRDRATVLSFEKGSSSVYALAAKDQLVSFQDLNFASCSAQETAEVERSARSQREAAEEETKQKAKVGSGRRPVTAKGDGFGDGRPVAAAPTLVNSRMDKHWKAVGVATVDPQQEGGSLVEIFVPYGMVQRVAARAGHSPGASDPAGAVLSFESTRSSTTNVAQVGRAETPPAKHDDDFADPSASSTTTLFFMRSHVQPIVLACHRTRWLVLSWSADGPAASVREASVRRLSLAIDHLSHLRTAKPFLAACVANWLWEHGGVRSHVGSLVRAPSKVGRGEAMQEREFEHQGAAVTKETRPAREALLAAAEEFLRLDALFSRVRVQDGRGRRPLGDKGASSDVSFMSLLTGDALRRCPWPGAWDRWVQECLREAQVRPPLQPAVAAHLTLLHVLRVSTVCGLPEGDVLSLFERGRSLCGPSALHDELLAPPFAQTQAPGASGVEGVRREGGDFASRREEYIRRALEAIAPRPAQNVFRLARDFGISEDTVRGWHCLILLRRGHDVLGEEAMSQVLSLQDLPGEILTILRMRLKRFLKFLETSPRTSGGVLASLDADTCQWVRSVKEPEAVAVGKGVRTEDETGERPLRSTHGVLLCLARALPPESRHKRQANALVTMVDTMLRSFASI